MAEVLLFHHVQGLTPGVRAFADALRERGHVVHAPDLFEGLTFETLEQGLAHARATGFETIVERGRAVADGLPQGLVYAGFSMGVLPAQCLAQQRPGAKGALLLESCVPPSEFGDGWPEGVPVEVHGMDADPSFAGEGDIDAARDLVASTPDAELFTYPGDRHLFTDSSLAAYEPEAAELVLQRVLAFLARVDIRAGDGDEPAP